MRRGHNFLTVRHDKICSFLTFSASHLSCTPAFPGPSMGKNAEGIGDIGAEAAERKRLNGKRRFSVGLSLMRKHSDRLLLSFVGKRPNVFILFC